MVDQSRLDTIDSKFRDRTLPFSLDSKASFSSAVDELVARLDDDVQALAFGEPMHGAEEFLALRNRLFRALVETHGFRAIAIESSFPRGRLSNEFIAGQGHLSLDEVLQQGFSHGFGNYAENRKLVEWMRDFNHGRPAASQVRFYGFDSPTEMMTSDSPRRLVAVAVDYLGTHIPARGEFYRNRIEPHLGDDAAWENPAAAMDPAQSIGGSAAAVALRLEIEDLIAKLQSRRPELITLAGHEPFDDALRCAVHARQMLTYHACVARESPTRVADLLGMRDVMMADNLAHIVARERERGRVFVFAHNQHLKYGKAVWQMGSQLLEWWPAGAHLKALIGARYAVIGSGVGTFERHGIATPEAGTLESALASLGGQGCFLEVGDRTEIDRVDIETIVTRSPSAKNPGYFPFTPQAFSDFDWLLMLNEIN